MTTTKTPKAKKKKWSLPKISTVLALASATATFVATIKRTKKEIEPKKKT